MIDISGYCLVMEFGLFLQPVHHPSENPTIALERDLELVELLDKLGYDEVWVGEHHSTGWENIAAPEAFIAAAAQRTSHIRLGTGIIQLGLHHPLITIDRMIFLDHLTRGRTMFGVGVGGGLPSDLKVFGLSPEEAGKRLDEGMNTILRLLESQEPLNEKTDWFELHNAVLQLKPYTRPHMPFAVASTNPRNIELMGRLGGKVLTGPTPNEVPAMYQSLERGAKAHGMKSSRDQIMLSFGLHLAQSHDQAMAELKEGLVMEHLEFNVGVNGRSLGSDDPDWIVEEYVKRYVVGTPDDAIAQIEGMLEASGGFGGILFLSRDWVGTEASNRSWELFARQVAPHFQGHGDQQLRAAREAAQMNSSF